MGARCPSVGARSRTKNGAPLTPAPAGGPSVLLQHRHPGTIGSVVARGTELLPQEMAPEARERMTSHCREIPFSTSGGQITQRETVFGGCRSAFPCREGPRPHAETEERQCIGIQQRHSVTSRGRDPADSSEARRSAGSEALRQHRQGPPGAQAAHRSPGVCRPCPAPAPPAGSRRVRERPRLLGQPQLPPPPRNTRPAAANDKGPSLPGGQHRPWQGERFSLWPVTDRGQQHTPCV